MAYSPEDREDAYSDLGGNAPSELSEGSENALYDMGLGKPEMRARVEKRRRLAADAAQRAINQVGAANFREAAKEQDRAAGKDVDSPEAVARERVRALRRTQPF